MTEPTNQNDETKASEFESLVETLGSEDCTKRKKARETLVACGQPAVKYLIGSLTSPKTQVRWEAAKTLAEIPDAAAIPVLIKTLGDDDCGVRWVAGEALIRLGEEAIAPLLQAVIENTTRIRDGAHHVLHYFAHQNSDFGLPLRPVVEALQTLEAEIAAPVAAGAALEALRHQ